MKVIGITGGIGAGKSELLAYVRKKYNCQVILADEAAHQAEEPGQKCYEELVALLGGGILNPDATINKARMAEKIFADKKTLAQVNDIIHPAVKQFILQVIADRAAEAELDFLFIEAALLIEDGYGEILDELWYVYSEPSVRRSRLKRTRDYSDEKINQIMQKQLSEEEFRKHCHVTIYNNGSMADAYRQIDEKLEEYLCQR